MSRSLSLQSLKSVLPVSVKHAVHQCIWPYRRATSHFRCLPDFLVIGAQKSGTTSLFYFLTQHRQVLSSSRKEVRFFDSGPDQTDTYAQGEHWYRAHFPLRSDMHGQRMTGEATPSYIYNPLVPERIRSLIPEVKLIAVLRNPTERAISQYFHEQRKGRETLSIADALRAEEARLAPLLQHGDYKNELFLHASYKSRGRYREQIERYLRCFPHAQLHVLSSEELFGDPLRAMDQVHAFLGLDQAQRPRDMRPQNVARNRTAVSAEIYDELDEYFRPHNEALFELIGKRFDW